MNISFNLKTSIKIPSSNLKEIVKAFFQIQSTILITIFQTVLCEFAELYMKQKKKIFTCERCKNNIDFIWKTHQAKKTSILTLFGKIFLNQLQIQCKKCGKKMFITRTLLGIERQKQIPFQTIRQLGLMGALASYRVCEKICNLFGWQLNKMTVWRSVQRLGKSLNFTPNLNETNVFEADGTGIPIQGIKKRGKELKILVQRKKTGGVMIAGASIGNYDSQWDKVFKPLIVILKKFKQIFLVTDGDTSILKSVKNKVKVIFQRCLWHIPHQLKYFLWKDGVKRKGSDWNYILTKILNICAIRKTSEKESKASIDQMIKEKEKELDKLIEFSFSKNLKHSTAYLQNAKHDMFTGLRNRLEGKTTSLVERVMRTVNLRANMGKWSPVGALNAIKIRLAYYYNGFDVSWND